MIDTSALPVRPSSLAELRGLVGAEIGPTDWHEVTQERIDAFAELTGDRQWIHVDAERAAASPLGGTIAHGLYSLSLGPAMSYALLSFEGFAHSLNYGYDTVRFPAPVPVGSRIRMRSTILAVTEVPGGIQVRVRQTFEREGAAKPIVVAEAIARVVESPPTAG
ncbi:MULTISPECIES: MaoC family dehydratase [Actinokineospora]|uniref:MaoC family dehydratase n=1 Tax=Actinokineospora fastidiosa TaxID=1816 RepID=A0A918GML2_9PSEU|nr:MULTISPECIES: MaoC family dehydratase [Actinokineospora]UVS78612.1 putative enoyl-CoA hydratase 1 [Actinokineospora sp. UTMC 2448]GGS45632.1 MaoC family dehydratase [Actinokineospora fastidiosa]